jgi:hypothetical protein
MAEQKAGHSVQKMVLRWVDQTVAPMVVVMAVSMVDMSVGWSADRMVVWKAEMKAD